MEDSSTTNSGCSITNNTFHHSSEIVHEIKLIKILTEIGAPLYAYKTLMEWAHKAQMSNFNFDTSHKTYQQTMKYLEEDLKFHIDRPKYVPVRLVQDNTILQVVVFDVKKTLSSLFDDPNLNQFKNLVVNGQNRFAKYEPIDGCYGEVNSGLWYQNAYNSCIKDPNKEFLCPIILASDKTTLSEMGDLHVDAIFMTTTLFNTKVCKQHRCFALLKFTQHLTFCRLVTKLKHGG